MSGSVTVIMPSRVGVSVKTLKYHYGFCVIYSYSLIIFWICCAFKIHQWCLGKILYKKNKSAVHINISLTNISSLFVGRFDLTTVSDNTTQPFFVFVINIFYIHTSRLQKEGKRRAKNKNTKDYQQLCDEKRRNGVFKSVKGKEIMLKSEEAAAKRQQGQEY